MFKFRKKGEDSLKRYKIGECLGFGSLGMTYIGQNLETGEEVAIEQIKRTSLSSPNTEKKLLDDLKLRGHFKNRHVIDLIEVIETRDSIYIVMEHLNCGHIFDIIGEKGKLEENEARKYFQQIIAGLGFFHKYSVAGWYLRPENQLRDSEGNVKIADFGRWNFDQNGHSLKTSREVPSYTAPEVLGGGELKGSPEGDIWTCGVILYALLYGSLPFKEESISNLLRDIEDGSYVIPAHVSDEARDLIQEMLRRDPLQRIKIRDICQSPWFYPNLPTYLQECIVTI